MGCGWNDKVNALLGACTSAAAFGCDVIHEPKYGAAQTLKGIWSDVYISVEPESGIQVMSSDPNLGFRLIDFKTAPVKHDIFIRNGVKYRGRAPEPDGEGGITIVLERVVDYEY